MTPNTCYEAKKMHLEVTISALRRISERLNGLSESEYVLIADILAELGLLVLPRPEGGFDFQTLVDYAKTLVVQELMRIAKMKGSEDEEAR